MEPSDGMNGYGLVASIIQSLTSLGWPIALVVLACVYRRPFQTLLRRMKSAKGWGTELEFEEQLEEAEAVAVTLPAPPEEAPSESKEKTRFEKLLDISPAAAVVDKWLEIESAMEQISENLNLRGGNSISIANQIVVRLNTEERHLLRELRELRNAAVHGKTIDEDQALRFLKLADQFVYVLDMFQKRRMAR